MNMIALRARVPSLRWSFWRLQSRAGGGQLRLAAVYVALAGIAIAAYFTFSGTAAAAAYVATSSLALVALLVGAHIHHPSNAWPWRWLAIGQAAFLLGDVIWFADDLSGTDSFPSMADASYLAGYPLFAVGLALFIITRRPKYSIARLIDAGAIAFSFLVLLLLAYVPKIAGQPGLDDLGKLTLLAYPTGDAVLLGAAAYLLFGGNGWRGRAQMSLLAGLVLLTVADVLYGLYLSDTAYAQSLLDGIWMLSYVAVGLAALLPSMRELTEPQRGAAEVGATRATMALLVAVAVLTVAAVVGDLGEQPNQAVIEVVQVALIGLLFMRAHEATSREARHERRVAALLANASDAMAVVRADGLITLSNPAAERLIGIPSSVSSGRSIFDFATLLHPDDESFGSDRMRAVLSTPGALATSDLRVRQPDGSYRWLAVSAVNRVTDPSVGAVVMNFRDVTEARRSSASLLRLGTAIAQASDAVIVTDAEARIEYVNPAFEQITGYTSAEVIGRNPRILKSGEQTPRFYESMWNMLTHGKSWRADFVNRRKDGTLYRMVGAITPLRDESGRLTGYVGVQRDVTRQRELESSAHRTARERVLIAEMIRGIDPRQSPESIAQSVCTQLIDMTELAIAGLFIFESDGRATQYGMAVRDNGQVPRRRLPRARTKYLRERSAVGPWIETWREPAGHPYREVIGRLGIVAHGYAPVRVGNEVIGFIVAGISAGDAAEERLAGMLQAIVEVADISGVHMGVTVSKRTELSAERARIALIIDNVAFHPVYQALCDGQTGRVVGYEALTRFDDGTPPDIRFAEAHEAGLGEKLELAAVAAAITGAAGLPGEIWLNVNASPGVVMDGGGLKSLVADCERDLVLEVTEHTEITDYPAFRQAVQELGPKVRLAVDDAGAGFASLRHIIELRPTFVKLDRQVIAGIDNDEARQAMVAGLLHFARATGCWLIAEGVETPAELQALRGLDVRYVQGYLLGRPVPADQLVEAGRSATLAPQGGQLGGGLLGKVLE